MSNIFSNTVLNIPVNHPTHPVVGVTLLAAGIVPNWFDSSHLSAIYYLCLIPPAMWYCGNWFVKDALPAIKRLLCSIST